MLQVGHVISSVMSCLAVPRVSGLREKLRTDVSCAGLYGVFVLDLWEIFTTKDVKGRK